MSAPSSDVAAIRQIIRALVADGYTLHSVCDADEETLVKNETEAIAAIDAVDIARLWVWKGSNDDPIGWVLFVLGNDPEEVAADWTTNLTPVDTVTDSWWS